MIEFEKNNWRWQLADGRIWSTAHSDFVADAEARLWASARGMNALSLSPVDAAGEHSEAGLRDALILYGLPLGTLALPTLAEAHAATVQAINAAFEAAMAPLTAGVPSSVTATYSDQRAEAEAYTADTTALTPMLDSLAAARGIEKADLAKRVLEKSALYKQASGQLLGRQQALMDNVKTIMSNKRLSEAKKVSKLKQLDITIELPRRKAKRKGKTS